MIKLYFCPLGGVKVGDRLGNAKNSTCSHIAREAHSTRPLPSLVLCLFTAAPKVNESGGELSHDWHFRPPESLENPLPSRVRLAPEEGLAAAGPIYLHSLGRGQVQVG